MTVYVFLIKREQDKEAWPCVYMDLKLAVEAKGRVSDVMAVVLRPK